MESPSWVVLALTFLVSLAFLQKLITLIRHRTRKFPPGPRAWPIIGNLYLVGSVPHRSLQALSKKYGDIMQLKFGSYPVVVASSPEMAREFLKTHDEIFASRPATAAGKHINYNFSALTWTPYGPYQRTARKIFLSELFNSKQLDSFEHIRIEERRALYARLSSMSGEKVQLKQHLLLYTLTNISRMVLSNKYFDESNPKGSIIKIEDLHGMINEWIVLNGVFNIGDWIPWLGFLDIQGYVKRMKALARKSDIFYSHVLEDHKLTKPSNDENFVAKDMVDVLLHHTSKNTDTEVKFTTDAVKGLMQDLINGGTDSTAVTVEWAISELLKQPHIFKRATEELDRVVGRERWVEERDVSKLPFIEAIMKETMRFHPIATLLPCYATKDCQVKGHDISKGTFVVINAWGIGRDPRVWDEPEKFKPERFLGKEIDVRGQHFQLLPFGSGRRMCPAYPLGLKMIFSTLANLIHGFDWELPDAMRPDDLEMEEKYGLATQKKNPVVVVTKPRLPPHMY